MQKRLIFLTLLISWLTLPIQTSGETDKIAVSVNGVNITEAEVQRAIDNQIARGLFHRTITQEKREQFRDPVVKALIENELLYQEAKKLGLSVNKSDVKEIFNNNMASFKRKKDFYKNLEKQGLDEDSYKGIIERDLLIRMLLKQEVEDKAKISEGEIEKYYSDNRKIFVSPEKLRMRSIFMKVPANATSEERAEKRRNAWEIINKAKAGEDFAKLAMEFSEDNYKDEGGDTGYLHLNMLEEEMAKEIAKLRPGDITGIIEHIYGFYIFKLEDKQPERQLGFDEVKDRLMIEFPVRKKKEIRETFINGLKAKAKIEVFPVKEAK